MAFTPLKIKLPTNVRRIFDQIAEGPVFHATKGRAFDHVDMTRMGYADNFGTAHHWAEAPETAFQYGDLVRTGFFDRGEGLDLYNLGPSHIARLKKTAESPLEREALDYDLALVTGRREPRGAELAENMNVLDPVTGEPEYSVYPTATHEILENNPDVALNAGYSAIRHHDIDDQNWAVYDPAMVIDIDGTRLGEETDPQAQALMRAILGAARNIARFNLSHQRVPSHKYDRWSIPDAIKTQLRQIVAQPPSSLAATTDDQRLEWVGQLKAYMTGAGRTPYWTMPREMRPDQLQEFLERIRAVPGARPGLFTGVTQALGMGRKTRFSEKTGPTTAPVEHRGSGHQRPTTISKVDEALAQDWNQTRNAWRSKGGATTTGGYPSGTFANVEAGEDPFVVYANTVRDPELGAIESFGDIPELPTASTLEEALRIALQGSKDGVALSRVPWRYQDMIDDLDSPDVSSIAIEDQFPTDQLIGRAAGDRDWFTAVSQNNGISRGLWDVDRSADVPNLGTIIDRLLSESSIGDDVSPKATLRRLFLTPKGYRLSQEPSSWHISPREDAVHLLNERPGIMAMVDPNYLNAVFDRDLYSMRISPKDLKNPQDFVAEYLGDAGGTPDSSYAHLHYLTDAMKGALDFKQDPDVVRNRVAEEVSQLGSSSYMQDIAELLKQYYALSGIPAAMALQQALMPREEAAA